jgi:hypothetical protein
LNFRSWAEKAKARSALSVELAIRQADLFGKNHRATITASNNLLQLNAKNH